MRACVRMPVFALFNMTVCRCVSAQGVEFCDSPSLCSASLGSICRPHDANCSACVLKHRKGIACVGEQSAVAARGFCASCTAFLDRECGAAKSENRTECSKCVKNRKLESEILYSGCDTLAVESYCGPPAPPKPVTCNWNF